MTSGVNLHVNTEENQLSYIIFLRLVMLESSQESIYRLEKHGNIGY